jgi:hypothetical protein
MRDLKDMRVFITIPCYTGQVDAIFCSSLLANIRGLEKAGVHVKVNFQVGDSDISKCRNVMTAKFLESDCTEMIMADCDLGFDHDTFEKILKPEAYVVMGAYPYRDGTGKYPCQILFNDKGKIHTNGSLIELDRGPTGMLRISRNVIEEMTAAHPEWKTTLRTPSGGVVYAIFDSGIQPDLDEGVWYSEDFVFCFRWRQMGGKIWCDPTILFEHVGSTAIQGMFAQHLAHCLDEIEAEQAKEEDSRKEEPCLAQ